MYSTRRIYYVVGRKLDSYKCCLGSILAFDAICFVVDSLLCSERFFSEYSGFLLSSKPSV